MRWFLSLLAWIAAWLAAESYQRMERPCTHCAKKAGWPRK